MGYSMKIGDIITFNGKRYLFKGDATETGYFIGMDVDNNYAGIYISYHDFVHQLKPYNPRYVCFRFILDQTKLLDYQFFINDMCLRYAKKRLGLNVKNSYDVRIQDHDDFTDFIIKETCKIKKGEA